MAYADCVLCEFGNRGNLNCNDPVCRGIDITTLNMTQLVDFDRSDFMISGSELCAFVHFGIDIARQQFSCMLRLSILE